MMTIRKKKWFLRILLANLSISGLLYGNSPDDKNPEANDIPNEEFWLYMAEFSEDEDDIDPEALMKANQMKDRLIKNKSNEKNPVSSEQLPPDSEVSL